MHDSVVRRHKSVGNYARGLWFDFDCDNVLLEEAYLCENVDGLKFEVCQGPILVKNCEISNNSISGILFHVNRDITIQGCEIANNDYYQLQVDHGQVSRYFTDWYLEEPAGDLDLSNIAFLHTVVGGSGSQKLVHIPDFEPFKSTLESNHNYWYHLDAANVFAENTSSCPLCTPTLYDFSGWQSLTAQDSSSVFRTVPPTPAYCGDWATEYPTGDINEDCRVNLNDFAAIADIWLDDTTEIAVIRDHIIEPIQDTTFDSQNYNDNSGGVATQLVNWIWNGGGIEKRCSLLQCDVGSIDPCATDSILSATLHISANVYGNPGEVHGWKFHRMLVPWSESSTYNQLYGLRAGIEYDATPFNSYIHNSDDGGDHVYMDGFETAVEHWADGTWANYGFIIISYAPSGATFNSVEFRSREYLTVQHRSPVLTVRTLRGAVCDDAEAKWLTDLNGDCCVDVEDLDILSDHWLDSTDPVN